ncbi:MAG: methionyl-tRNA formyltransferase [Chloroflexi bacterium]|nr:MAG: methionyl-tRNA formyltransferase [Chloroflexota bacterium]
MRIVFFGSPDYALPTLRSLLAHADIEVVAVVTQPARPRGRNGTPEPTPIGALAAEVGITTFTPERIRRDTTAMIAALRPDVGVLAASGHLLPTHMLEAFPHGVLNVHASLLPRHRGASPVAAAILDGDAEAGASIMVVVRELDAGPVVSRITTAIDPLDTAGTLTDRIAVLGAREMLEVLPGWVAGTRSAEPQDETQTSYAPKLAKPAGVIDWSRDATSIWRQVRAFEPWPLATTSYAGSTLTIHEAWPLDLTSSEPPGTVIASDQLLDATIHGDRRAVAAVVCGSGALALLNVQRAGKRALDIEEYARGDRGFVGARLGA